MVWALLLAVALGAGIPSSGRDTNALRAAYRDARAQAGDDANSHVRLALWCESQGLTAERARELALAVTSDPSNPTARGLMGFVAYDGRWKRADDVAALVRSDDSLRGELAEYRARREGMPETAEAHWSLAVWCGAHGLGPESRAHLAVVTQLDPGRSEAWERLGYEKYHGRWLSESQIAAEQAEVNTQRQADAKWESALKPWWRDWLALPDPERRTEWEAHIGAHLEPRAVPAIRRLFVGGTAEQQRVAVSLLDRIDSVPSTEELAWLATAGHSKDVRDGAMAALARRDPSEVVEPLVGLMHDPFRLRVTSGQGTGTVADLWVEGEQSILHKSYTQQTVRVGRTPMNAGFGFVGSVLQPARPRSAQQQLSRDLRAIHQSNERREALTESARHVLVELTGEDQGAGPDAWRRWLADRRGYAPAPSTAPKPVITRVSRHVQYAFASGYHSNCFAQGTPVRTPLGLRPIETLCTGDRVLTEDPATGALSFQPIVAVYHNPPSPTLRIRLEHDELVSTPIHRFWCTGKGWILARNLKPGDTLRVLGGVARTIAVEPDQVQPVFNLDVAQGHTYLVGQAGAVVHDNTRVTAASAPFDAPVALAIGRDGKASTAAQRALFGR